MSKKILILTIAAVSLYSCNNEEKKGCYYTLNELLQSDTPKVTIAYKNDTLTEVHDLTNDTSYGNYVFDKRGNLRFYSFQTTPIKYKYSEAYDEKGNMIRTEGTPIVEYRIWNKESDSVLINIFLFALFKKFENIEVVTNQNDTILPHLLYKADFYTNVKCFAFALHHNKSDNLILYTKIDGLNTCTKSKFSFSDTLFFERVLR